MTFTYVGDLSTDLDKVRFYIDDTVEDSGVKPDSGNFTDEELGGLITSEGTWGRAVAAAFEVLTGIYGREVDITVGPRKEALSQAAKRYGELAEQWRKRHGGGVSTVGTRAVIPVDGYSDDVATDEI